MKQCCMQERVCIECGLCDQCDLDPNKRCDNCCSCIDDKEAQLDYAMIPVVLRTQQEEQAKLVLKTLPRAMKIKR